MEVGHPVFLNLTLFCSEGRPLTSLACFVARKKKNSSGSNTDLAMIFKSIQKEKVNIILHS